MSLEGVHWNERIQGASRIAQVDDEVISALIDHDQQRIDAATEGIAFQLIARTAECWGSHFSLRRIAEVDPEEIYGFDGSSCDIPYSQVWTVEKWRKGGIYAATVLAAESLVQFGLHGEPGIGELPAKIIEEALIWSKDHLRRVYPVEISRVRESPAGRELTLNQLMTSVVIVGVGIGDALSALPQFRDVPEIERYKVGMYLAIRIKKSYSPKSLYHILGALSSFGLVDRWQNGMHINKLMKGGVIAWGRMENTILEQSRLWSEFTTVKPDVLLALGRPVGRSRLTSLELLCRYYGWPFDGKMLKLIDECQSPSESWARSFWGYVEALPQEPPRESFGKIGDRYDVERNCFPTYILRAIKAIRTGDASAIVPWRSMPVYVPGKESSRDPTTTAERMTAAVSEALLRSEARDISGLSAFVQFDFLQRVRLLRMVQERLAVREAWMPFHVAEIYEDLAREEKVRIAGAVHSVAKEGVLRAVSIRYPMQMSGIRSEAFKEIVLELMTDPERVSFRTGSLWMRRNLAISGLSDYSQWKKRFNDLAGAAALNCSDALLRLEELQGDCPADYFIRMQTRLSYLRQYCAIAALSSGIQDPDLRKQIESHLRRRVPRGSLRHGGTQSLMGRLADSYELFKELQESTRPGVMEDLTAQLCNYLTSSESSPLVDVSVVSYANGYDSQFLSETICPDQFRIAAEVAMERCRANPGDEFNAKPYSTLFHYLNVGRRALLSVALA